MAQDIPCCAELAKIGVDLAVKYCPEVSALEALRDIVIEILPIAGQTILTTKLPFTDWGKIFDSTTAAAAIADRLVHRSEVLVLEGTSNRRKDI